MSRLWNYLNTRRETVYLLLILALAFLLRMVFLHEPFERDEGLYGYIGQEILRGAIPYRDVADLKPPGSVYIYAAMIAFFGNTTEAIRVATGFYALFTTYFVFRLARYLQGGRAGLCAALLFAVFSGAPLMQGSSSNTEVFMLLPLVICVYLFLRGVDTGRRNYFAGSGFAAGLAITIKTVALPYVVLIFLFLVLRPGLTRDWRSRGRDVLYFLIPPLVTALLSVAYFAYHGALADMYYWNVTIHKRYVQHESSRFLLRMRMTVDWLRDEQLLLWLSALAGSIWYLSAQRGLKSLLLLLLLVVSFVAVAMPGHFYPHYFIQLAPFCAVAGGVCLGRLFERRGWLLYVSLPLIAVGSYLHVKADYDSYFVFTPEQVSTYKYGMPVFAQSVGIARYIRDRTAPDDYIVQWGFEQELYFLSNRRGLRNLHFYLNIAWAPDPEKALREMQEGIATKKPKYIIVQNSGEYLQIPGFAELEAIIDRDYFLEHQQDYALIFRRKAEAG